MAKNLFPKHVPLIERWKTEENDPIIIIKKAPPMEEVNPGAGEEITDESVLSKE